MSPDGAGPEKEALEKPEAIIPETSPPEVGGQGGAPELSTGLPPKPQRVGEFGWKFDNEEDPNRFFIEIPLDAVAADPSMNGIIFLLGFFENCKNEAVAQVRKKRMVMAQKGAGKLILPGQRPLRVH